MMIRIYTIAILLLTAQAVFAQEEPVKEKQTPQQEQAAQQQAAQQRSDIRFVDEDGDGINDNALMRGQRDGRETEGIQIRERRRDHFIDNDGDGINDNRCSGVGIMQGKRRGQQKGGQK
ncbi:MAG: hypothetical protein JXA28_10870 [Bacteroidetes bacterium]|nr:hypothetical protein [Bacteroidota bacterium]